MEHAEDLVKKPYYSFT